MAVAARQVGAAGAGSGSEGGSASRAGCRSRELERQGTTRLPALPLHQFHIPCPASPRRRLQWHGQYNRPCVRQAADREGCAYQEASQALSPVACPARRGCFDATSAAAAAPRRPLCHMWPAAQAYPPTLYPIPTML